MKEYNSNDNSSECTTGYDCTRLPPDIGALFEIFRKLGYIGQKRPITPEDYMEIFRCWIIPIGRAFVWLRLAKPDNSSPFRFSATSTLMRALVNQTDLDSYKLLPKSSAGDDVLVRTIWKVAYGSLEKAFGHAGIVNEALMAAGLAVRSKRDEEVTIPTVLLRQLVASRGTLDLEAAVAEDRKHTADSSAQR